MGGQVLVRRALERHHRQRWDDEAKVGGKVGGGVGGVEGGVLAWLGFQHHEDMLG